MPKNNARDSEAVVARELLGSILEAADAEVLELEIGVRVDTVKWPWLVLTVKQEVNELEKREACE